MDDLDQVHFDSQCAAFWVHKHLTQYQGLLIDPIGLIIKPHAFPLNSVIVCSISLGKTSI